jgi:hypothetical protein
MTALFSSLVGQILSALSQLNIIDRFLFSTFLRFIVVVVVVVMSTQ